MPFIPLSKERLKNLIRDFPSAKILVWGDAILDEYIYGEVWRISREAPVLILKYRGREFIPGGALNAVRNLVSLGARVYFWGWIGKDREGEILLDHLSRLGVDTGGVWREKQDTVVKTRILAGGTHRALQQMLRIDKGERKDSLPEDFFWRNWRDLKEEIDGILISDYGYGSVSPSLYQRLREDKEGIWVVDSRFSLNRFPNPTVITPNEDEATASTGEEDPLRGAEILLQKLSPQAVVLTRGNRGMVLLEEGKEPFSLPAFGPREVVDVTGAGDTVASVITLALSRGGDIREAVYLANLAGGLVVQKFGSATLKREEIEEALEKDYGDSQP